jgi:Ribonuclease G/E
VTEIVIPGRYEVANPESRRAFGVSVWIPDPALRAVPE